MRTQALRTIREGEQRVSETKQAYAESLYNLTSQSSMVCLLCCGLWNAVAVMKGYTQSGQLNHEQYLLETALSALSDTWLPYIAKLCYL